METFILLFIIIGGIFVYFYPTFVAVTRGRENTLTIFIINLLFGYTFFGWIFALILAYCEDED